MKAWNGYENTQPYTDTEKLPVGGYVLDVKDVQMSYGRDGGSDILVISFDIAEGDYAGFFRSNYAAQPETTRKWKGTYRLFCPKDDGTEQDAKTKRRFKTVVKAFEASNSGYVWDWNERRLIGKQIGGIFNRREYNIDGRHGYYTNCYSLISAQRIRDGNYTVPDDTRLKDNSGFAALSDADAVEIPF